MKNTENTCVSILIAEDDSIMQEFLQESFTQMAPCVKVRLVPDGSKAVHFLTACTYDELPDLILLDYNMPFMTGEEVLEKIYGDERYNSVPKVILSSWIPPEKIRNCLKLGMTKYFPKPSSFSEFHALVKEVVGLILKKLTL